MTWRIEVQNQEGVFDAAADGIKKDIADLGVDGIEDVEIIRVYHIEGDISKPQAEEITTKLLTNPVTQRFHLNNLNGYRPRKSGSKEKIIEIAHNPGVTDPVEASTLKGIRDLGVKDVRSVRTAYQYRLRGALNNKQINTIVNKVLANKLIQHVVRFPVNGKMPAASAQKKVELVLVDILGAGDAKLKKISRDGQLFLNLDEMKAVQKHFDGLGRNPTDCELETIAQTWSEHCYHKTFRGNIHYRDRSGRRAKEKTIRNLLKSTIVKATETIDKPWCVSVFHDNAGVIKFDKDYHVCFKVETHNHPSALEPFGGANTGIGGVIRDILGTGLGAKPICNTDVFCFAPPETPFDRLPEGVLHPKRVMKGVVSGVRDYGNKMGIPTVNGSISFDKDFIGNPLVYCGTVGLIPKNRVKKKPRKGDLIVAVGGRTGRDGIHGATFSSGELSDESESISSGAVQIGDPIQEKKMMDTLLKARDEGLYSAITDCGAGGFSSAVGEMGEELGALVHLDKVPLKYEGLRYMEIWISESQERMVLSVPQENVERLLEIFTEENVEASVIGEFTGRKRLEIFYRDVQVADLQMKFLHDGIPNITKEAVWRPPKLKSAKLPKKKDLNSALVKVLSHGNVCSKEWVIRQYDHEVQGGSVVKPLVGVDQDGPSDASVVLPRLGSSKGIAVSNGINFRFGKIDPFWMAASCIDEAVRQIIAVGGDVERIAILDNFCWGNPDKPDRLGGLVRCAEGCYKAAVGFQVPFISGKDSLYNEFTQGRKSIAIPGTILISALGIVENVAKTVSMDFKEAGSLLYCVGETFDELGGSIYLDTLNQLGKNVPQVNPSRARKSYVALTAAVQKGLVAAMHDCSEGGLAVAAAEMAFASGIGARIELADVKYKGKTKADAVVLFSESNSRILVEVKEENRAKFEKAMKGTPTALIGTTETDQRFQAVGLKGEPVIDVGLKTLKNVWQEPLRW